MLIVKHSLHMMTSRQWPKGQCTQPLVSLSANTQLCLLQCWHRSSFRRCWCENAVSTTAKFSSCKTSAHNQSSWITSFSNKIPSALAHRTKKTVK